jgi:hypothetical protein
MKKTIESQTADTILQRPVTIEINGEKYEAAPPTTATLILVSELVAQLPAIKLDPENILHEALGIARDCHPLAEIVAVLILGAKNIRQKKTVVKRRFFGLIKDTHQITINRQKELAETIENHLSPRELYRATAELLTRMEIADFFAFTTSLTEINLTRATRVGTTVSGR